MFEKGHVKVGGRKVGRPVGSLTRRNQAAKDLVEKLGYDPLEALLRIAKDKKRPLDMRIEAMKASVPFVHPKLSTATVTANVKSDIEITRKVQLLVETNPDIAKALEAVALRLVEKPPVRIIDITPEPLSLPVPLPSTPEEKER